MSATASPFGVRPVSHPSGTVRLDQLAGGVVSAYGTAIYTNTPIKRDTNGTLIPCSTGADVSIGVFAGCEFTASSKRFVLPYWPAAQTYDAGTMIAYYTSDPHITYEAQADGAVPLTENGESINLANTSQGSVYTGQSTQALTATTTGASAGTFQIIGLAPYDDNEWGDAYTILRVKISSYQGPVA
jgi:hypothetical protein